jgi:hypothetical protein
MVIENHNGIVMLPLDNDEAGELGGWIKCYPREFGDNVRELYKEWCKQHVPDDQYFVTAWYVWFQFEQDAELFLLRWS